MEQLIHLLNGIGSIWCGAERRGSLSTMDSKAYTCPACRAARKNLAHIEWNDTAW